MKRIRRHSRRDQRGTVIVELAVLLPFLLMFCFLLMEGGAMLRMHIVLNNAAREGARVSALPEYEGQIAKVKQAVIDYAALNGVALDANEITVVQDDTVPGPDDVFMSASRVTVDHPFEFTFLPKFSNVTEVTSLFGTAEFRNFY